MASAFLIYIATQWLKLPVLLSGLLVILFAGIMGMFCYKLLFDRVKERETAIVIISIALAILFQEIFLLAFGGSPLRIPPIVYGFMEIYKTRVTYQQIIAIGIIGVALISIWLMLSKTKIGNAIRAVAQDREIANLMGINVTSVLMMTMGLSVALAGVAAAAVAPVFMVHPLMWTNPMVVILSAVILGGLGSIRGTIIAAFILGFAETSVVFLVPMGSFLRGAVSLCIMVIILLIKPEGIFGIVFEEERL
jgi:branched-chain amino acid transport system permease protein